jgi:hypothetical protein
MNKGGGRREKAEVVERRKKEEEGGRKGEGVGGRGNKEDRKGKRSLSRQW